MREPDEQPLVAPHLRRVHQQRARQVRQQAHGVQAAVFGTDAQRAAISRGAAAVAAALLLAGLLLTEWQGCRHRQPGAGQLVQQRVLRFSILQHRVAVRLVVHLEEVGSAAVCRGSRKELWSAAVAAGAAAGAAAGMHQIYQLISSDWCRHIQPSWCTADPCRGPTSLQVRAPGPQTLVACRSPFRTED